MATSLDLDLVPYFRRIGLEVAKVEGGEIKVHCPAHPERKGRPDRSASFSFSRTKMVGQCFSCGFTVGSLAALVTYVTGAPPEQDVLLEAQRLSLASELDRITARKEQELADSVRYMEWTLEEKFIPVPSKLLELRRILRAAADFYQIRFDPKLHCQVIPIRSPKGQIWGWQRRQQGAVFNWPPKVRKSDTLFGLHLMEADRVALVESPLDAVRLHQVGIPAVSSFGAGVSNRQLELLARNFTVVVLALDNDPTGIAAAERCQRSLRRRTGV